MKWHAMSYRYHVLLNAIIGILVFSIDRFTKLWALDACQNEYVINRYISCELVFNRGLSWSIFDSPNNVVFMAVSATIALVMVGFMIRAYQLYCQQKRLWGATLVIAGALGNFVDRILYGGVVDFISIGSFPIFNVADIAICCGIAIMILMHRDQF